MAGRPSAKLELNLNQTDATLELIKPLLLKQALKLKIEKFAKALNALLYETKDISTQTQKEEL